MDYFFSFFYYNRKTKYKHAEGLWRKNVNHDQTMILKYHVLKNINRGRGNRYKIFFIYKINCFKTNFRFYSVFKINLFETQKRVIIKYYDIIIYCCEYKIYVIMCKITQY